MGELPQEILNQQICAASIGEELDNFEPEEKDDYLTSPGNNLEA